MASKKQVAAAKKNVQKAQAAWKSMTKRQHALAQPQGRGRIGPGTGGAGKFYHIEIRPKGQFTSFRTQDVGKKGGLERVAGRRSSGSWATATWLVAKESARVVNKKLIVTNAKEKSSLAKAIRGPITWVKGDVFHAYPAKNVPEQSKPTGAMKKARAANIKKAQSANRKRS